MPLTGSLFLTVSSVWPIMLRYACCVLWPTDDGPSLELLDQSSGLAPVLFGADLVVLVEYPWKLALRR